MKPEIAMHIPEPERDKEATGRKKVKQNVRNNLHHLGRMIHHSGSVTKEFFREHGFTTIGIPAAGVAVLGAAEGGLYSNWDPKYMAVYGLSKLTAAPIWVRDTQDAVAAIANVDPASLRNFASEAQSGKISQEEAGELQFYADKLYQVSSLLGGVTLFVNAGNFALTLNNARRKLTEDIKAGREPMFKSGEQVFFVGGRQSNVLEARMDRDAQNTVPILEEPQGADRFIERASQGGKVPAFIDVEGKHYGASNVWKSLKFNPEWLIDVQGRKKLIVVGDGSVYEEALDLKDESAIDVTVKELQITADKLKDSAQKAGALLDDQDVIRIYLGNAGRDIQTGGGKTIDLRDHIKQFASVEVFIDTRMPIVERILAWLDGKTEIVFDTTNRDYYKTVSELLNTQGVAVYDQCDDYSPGIPHLVYEEVTAATVKRAQEIAYHNGVSRDNVLAITDTLDGHLYAAEEKVSDLCTAKVYDAEIENVISLLKKGNTPQIIQEWLDYRWDASASPQTNPPSLQE